MAFEQLMAEAAVKKGKDDKKDSKKAKKEEAKKEDAKKEEASTPHHHGIHMHRQKETEGKT